MSDGKTRYYVHGDKREEKPEEYYCASCDSFEAQRHFYENSHGAKCLDGYAKYKQSLKNWQRISKNKARDFEGRYYRRPANPVNIES